MVPQAQHRNRHVIVDQTHIIANALTDTFLTADISASSGTLTVANIEKFSTGKYVWINPFSERSEIIAVHASTSPSGSTITLASNTSYAHYTGEPIYYVEFDQAEISHASTAAGSKSVLDTVALEAGARDLRYLDTSQTSGFYFVRLKDSVAGTFGNYTDALQYDGWDSDTVGYMIDAALRDLGINLSGVVQLTDCYRWLTEGMNEIKGKLRNFPEHVTYNAIVGQTSRGINTVTMPTDAYDTETRRSVLGVRIGGGGNLAYLDPVAFDIEMGNVNVTQVRTEATSGDTSLAVDNTYDFDDTGTLHAYVSGSLDSFTYDGITRDDADGGTAAFTSIPSSGDDSIENTLSVDTNIWQDETEGTPQFFTVRNGSLEFWPLVDAEHDNQNIYMDYAKVATAVDSDGDTIDLHRFDVLSWYLKWRMWCKARNNGNLDRNNAFFIQYKETLNDMIRTLPSDKKHKWHPKLNTMSKRWRPLRPDVNDLSVDEQ